MENPELSVYPLVLLPIFVLLKLCVQIKLDSMLILKYPLHFFSLPFSFCCALQLDGFLFHVSDSVSHLPS